MGKTAEKDRWAAWFDNAKKFLNEGVVPPSWRGRIPEGRKDDHENLKKEIEELKTKKYLTDENLPEDLDAAIAEIEEKLSVIRTNKRQLLNRSLNEVFNNSGDLDNSENLFDDNSDDDDSFNDSDDYNDYEEEYEDVA